MNDTQLAEQSKPAKWKPISSLERRVLGVLAEKAKTTPDQYPLSLNALVKRLQSEKQSQPPNECRAD